MTRRGYEQVQEALSGLITGKSRNVGTDQEKAYSLMARFLERLGVSQERLGGLRVIHIAGTKGKGSTASFVERTLRECGYRTGLFTSPHLLDVRERIRIDGEPVDVDIFVEQFWSCYDTLKSKSDFEKEDNSGMPAYFRFLTLLGLQIFLVQKVDVAILEVGLGGRLDATNVIDHPTVCGITSLGMDHVEVLGDTIAKIAREKAGILKEGVPAFTVPQPEDAQAVLAEVAEAVGAPLSVTEPISSFRAGRPVRLGLAGRHQEVNAALALALVRLWEEKHGDRAGLERSALLAEGALPEEYLRGLERTFWPGRAQVIEDEVPADGPASGRVSFFLDGAHTAESMTTCGEWYSEASASSGGERVCRVLLFNCMQERDPENLLLPLTKALAAKGTRLDHALFVPPMSQYSSLRKGASADLSWQRSMQAVWDQHYAPGPALGAGGAKPALPPLPGAASWSPARGAVLPNLQVTLEWLRSCARPPSGVKLQVLVTGSLYMVGDVLRLLGQTRVK